MARARISKVPTAEPSPFNVVEDSSRTESEVEEELETNDQESDEDATSDVQPERRPKPISRSVREDIARFEESFKDLAKQYRLIDRIGEGKETCSYVYLS